MRLIAPEICPRCGASFDCGKSGKCWCYEVDTSTSLLEEINDTYDRCLCPACLNELNEKSKVKNLANPTE